MCIHRTDDGKCQKFTDGQFTSYCVDGPCPDDTPSNADRIREMGDEELANLICTADWCESCDQANDSGTCQAMALDGPLNKYCVAGALRWLKQPAEVEKENRPD